jgi:hypothetical protein
MMTDTRFGFIAGSIVGSIATALCIGVISSLRDVNVTPQRSGPDEWGVACYKRVAGGLSCVQVTPPRATPQRQGVPLS